MTAGPMPGAPDRCEFVVRPDGTVVGDDGAAGVLAAALPYTGRLARRAGELVEVGDLRALEALGTRHLAVGVTWTPAGEGTYRAVLATVEPRTVPSFMVVGGADTAATVAHCVDRVLAVEGVRWGGIVTAGSRVVAAAGDGAATSHLAEVGTRMLAILRSLEDQHLAGFVRLRFEEAAVVGASLGRHALVACAGATDDEGLLATIDEVRAILADRALRRGGRAGAAPRTATVRTGERQPQPRGNTSNVDAWVTPSPCPPPRRIPSRNSSGSQPSQPRPSM